MQRYVIIHYHEIALKGRNRPRFERQLLENVLARTEGLGVRAGRRLPGRLVLTLAPDASWRAIRERTETVFGIAYLAHAYRTPLDLDALRDAVVEAVPQEDYETFAIDTKRGNKRFPLKSYEVNADIGAAVETHTGKAVDLDNPDLTVSIEILYKQMFFFFDRVEGPGGLPVGVSGRVACLLSGGIDSPVAVYSILKRGCEAFCVHFHGHPYVTRTSEVKSIELVRQLVRYGASPYLWSVPFGPLQHEVMQRVPEKLRVVVYRRLMARIGQRLAEQDGAAALVTGESLAQVASQTLPNLATIESAVSIPILRPLIAWDKVEIVRQAKAIDTYDISILPGEDCCQLFVPRHPATATTIVEVEEAEGRLDVESLVTRGTETVKRIDVREMSVGAGEMLSALATF
ncbi:MAG: putative tRNA sulfurtransferase [Anaerolineales bacterium]|nr:putative tRNA sulfurtransferase [Anaerolineales bacterium]